MQSIPIIELPNYIGQPVHLKSRDSQHTWILKSIEGSRVVLTSPRGYSFTDLAANIQYVRRLEPIVEEGTSLRVIGNDVLAIRHGIIVHQVNLQGVMGAGLAKQIKCKYPIVCESYLKHLDKFSLGMIQLILVAPTLYVCNLAGQDKYGRGKQFTNYDAVRTGLQKLALRTKELNLPVYIPYELGCGYGGGDWKIVRTIINEEIPTAVIVNPEHDRDDSTVADSF